MIHTLTGDADLELTVHNDISILIDGTLYTEGLSDDAIVDATLSPEQTLTLYNQLTKLYKQQKQDQLNKFNDQVPLDL